MALVLTLKEGEDFFIGDVRLRVEKIDSPTQFTLMREADKVRFPLSEGRANEILPDVLVSVGARGQSCLARVAIEAPLTTLVLRGDIYRQRKSISSAS